jgi:N-methylhydantoinase B/oxoprolinase/acetone carboxylase alpha subunit
MRRPETCGLIHRHVVAVDYQFQCPAWRSAPRPVLYVLRTLVDEDIPLNEGCLAPLDLRIPAGSLLDPHPPAAVVAGNVETSQAIVDLLFGALGVLADSQGTMNNLTFGDADCQYYETIAGRGAGPGFAGASGVQTHMTNSRLTDPEIFEARLPVRLEAFRYRLGSGGQGKSPWWERAHPAASGSCAPSMSQYSPIIGALRRAV